MTLSISFYNLDVDRKRSFVDYGYGNDWEGIVCPLDRGHQRAGRRLPPFKLEVMRKRIVDFSSTMLGDVLITERALKCFRDAGLTGFKVEPTEVVAYTKKWDKPKTLTVWELIVVGTAGHAHPDSGIRLLRHCDACGSTKYSAHEHGIIVDESKWDGSDFFTVIEYTRHYLVTERVKKTVFENELTNAQFTPSHLLKWPEGVIKPE